MHTGFHTDIWTGCYTCPSDDLAVLCCVATNGYHSQVSYSWCHNELSLGESTPLMYCSTSGAYKCTIQGDEIHEERSFKVYSMV